MNYLIPKLAVRHGVFTLCCRKLTERLPHLALALNEDTRLTVEVCCSDFDDALDNFFRLCNEPEVKGATQRFVSGWRGITSFYQPLNNKAWDEVEHVATSALGEAPTWDYYNDIEHWHDVGRRLAQEYFADTTYSEIRDKLNRRARLVFPSDGAGSNSEDSERSPFGGGLAPVAYRDVFKDAFANQELTEVVLVRSASAKNLAMYLCYAFMFLHEYTAHIFINDYGNDLFNDGWMLFAAASFLQQKTLDAIRQGSEFSLNRAQVNIFRDEFLHALRHYAGSRLPARGYSTAEQIYGLLRDQDAGLTFQDITSQVAAFVPQGNERPQWPTQFLHRLSGGLELQGHQLVNDIRASTNIRDLYTRLEETRLS